MSNILASGSYQKVVKHLFKLDSEAAMNMPTIYDTHSIHKGNDTYYIGKDGKTYTLYTVEAGKKLFAGIA